MKTLCARYPRQFPPELVTESEPAGALSAAIGPLSVRWYASVSAASSDAVQHELSVGFPLLCPFGFVKTAWDIYGVHSGECVRKWNSRSRRASSQSILESSAAIRRALYWEGSKGKAVPALAARPRAAAWARSKRSWEARRLWQSGQSPESGIARNRARWWPNVKPSVLMVPGSGAIPRHAILCARKRSAWESDAVHLRGLTRPFGGLPAGVVSARSVMRPNIFGMRGVSAVTMLLT